LHDLSPDTLTFAALKGASEGLPVSTGVFDMRSCADFNGHFDCVLMVCSALLYMRTTDDAVAALSACRTQMKADGILIIDFTNYWGKLVAGRSASTLTEFESDGWRMRIESLATISSISGIAHARQTIARSRFGQSLPLIQRELAFRILNFLELQAHLIAAGLRIRELYGNFELDALSEKSCDRFLVVAARQHGN
jgi:SAM-dependent methyltransferase